MMPSFEASLERLEKLSACSIKDSDMDYAKSELDGNEGGLLKLKAADTNRPDLWSEEGVARVLRGVRGVSAGMPRLAAKRGAKKIFVGAAVAKVRPYISGFVAENVNVTDELLRGLIAVQENLSENFGRKRRQIAIGIYSNRRIRFPLKYDAVEPDSVRFVPLEFSEALTMREILQKHPKGTKYAALLGGFSCYPLLRDSGGEVLSFPPVINSNSSGKVEPGETGLFVEVTGHEQRQVMLAANILAQLFYDNGAKLESVASVYPGKTPMGREVAAPDATPRKITFPAKDIEHLLGIKLSSEEIVRHLESMQYDATVKAGKVTACAPCYRGDIMHPVDVIEDIAISYGYNNFTPLDVESSTRGGVDGTTAFMARMRLVMVGLGFQEVISPLLTSRLSSEKMNLKEEVLEIENPMSETYSAVRSSILPCLMQCLSRNRNAEYPQRIFEAGECVLKLVAKDTLKMAGCIADSRTSYEDMSSVLAALLRSLGFEFRIKAVSDPRFIEGRAGAVFCGGDRVGIVGEVHPQVLNNWGVDIPVVAFEINAAKLMERCRPSNTGT